MQSDFNEKPGSSKVSPNMKFLESETNTVPSVDLSLNRKDSGENSSMEKPKTTIQVNKLVPKLNAAPSPKSVIRQKTALKPGYSLMDWIRLGHSSKDLTGVGGRFLNVTEMELAKHNTASDAWLCINGKVYNVTAYMDYHPGGQEELLRGVGKDATELFMQTHRWVNYESMLQKCIVGRLSIAIPLSTQDNSKECLPEIFALPEVVPQSKKKSSLSYDWSQTESQVTFLIETNYFDIQRENVIVDLEEFQNLLITLNLKNSVSYFHIKLVEQVQPFYKINVSEGSGKVQLIFDKQSQNSWPNPGKFLKMHNCSFTYEENEMQYRWCKLITKRPITCDTRLFTFQLPEGSFMIVPLGHHVQVAKHVKGTEIVKSYTPLTKSLSYKETESEGQFGRHLHLMIKIYPEGIMTPELEQMKIGDKIKVSDHLGTFSMTQLSGFTHLILLAAGTGFTPMAGLINSMFYQKPSTMQVDLLFFNRQECHILWREQLDSLAAEAERFRVEYVLSEADDRWEGRRGRISSSVLSDFLSLSVSQQDDRYFCVCGPIAFTQEAVRLLEELKYDKSQIHAFLN